MPTTLAPGSFDDRVTLTLGPLAGQGGSGTEILIAESWDVEEGVLVTPGAFTLTLGQSTPVADLFTRPGTGEYPYGPKFPKGTPFQLKVGSAPQMSGVVEGFHVSGKATRITIKGRDGLGALMRSHSQAERSFIDGSYKDLVLWALQESGYPNPTLLSVNTANRQIKAGIPIEVASEPMTVDQINAPPTGPLSGITIGAVVTQTHQNRIRENILSFTRRHLDRAGLFLWAGAQPNTFILSQPNGDQSPSYQIVRKRSAPQLSSNVIDVSYTDDATHRHGQCAVYGRGGGRKAGRAKTLGRVVDEEMVNLGRLTGSGWETQQVLYRDVNVQLQEQGDFYASRKLAEERRNGWSLIYTVRGHRLPTPDGTDWGVITPDTTIHVEDDELGFDDVYYVESVHRYRRPETVTEVRLMRTNDLTFGTAGEDP